MELREPKFLLNHETPSDFEERWQAVREQLEFLSGEDRFGTPNAPDEYMQAFYTRLNQALFIEANPILQAIAQDALITQQQMSPANFANACMRSAQDYKLHADGANHYPLGHSRPEAWSDYFDAIEAYDPDDWGGGDAGRLWSCLHLNVQSNIAERGKLPKVIALLNGYDRPIRMLEVGCSRNHILKKLACEDGRPGNSFGETTVVHGEDTDLVVDETATHAFNQLAIGTPLGLRKGKTESQSLGIDIYDLRKDEQMKRWAESCSFYPSERLDEPERVQEYHDLEVLPVEEVAFHLADFAKLSPGALRAEFKKFHVVLFSTILYQADSAQRQAMLRNAYELVKSTGLVIVQDFVRMGPNDAMDFAETWGKWSYGVWVKRMADRNGFEKYLTVETGRAKRVKLEPALGRLPLARQLGMVPHARARQTTA